MKSKIILLLIFSLFSYSIAFAQTDYKNGLVLSGNIFGGTSSSGGLYWTDATVELKLTNKGKEPIILLLPYLEFGRLERMISWSGYSLKGKKFSYSKEVQGTTSEELKELAKNLDREKPPQNLTYILDRGESLEFSESVQVKINGEDKGILFLTTGVAEYKFSFLKYHFDPDLLEKLQNRWRKYGLLPVDKNGEFSITLEILK